MSVLGVRNHRGYLPTLQSPVIALAADAIQQVVERTRRLRPRGQRSAVAWPAKTLKRKIAAVVDFMLAIGARDLVKVSCEQDQMTNLDEVV